MNTFGLGLVLNFTDNASAGMRSATQTFNQLNGISNQVEDSSSRAASAIQALTQAGMGLNIVGNQLTAVGQSITGVFSTVISSTNAVGSTLMSARAQLSTLYQDAEKGEEVLQNIKSYAAKSIFNFEDLIPSVIMLKANGIEAFDEIASSTGKSRQTLMDYAADLAAFNPQMRNMYGTGVQAAMGALNEYIAEGNAKSLKTGASLDITALLGEEKGKTIEERSRQVADLLEQLNMVGMVSNMAGTASQRLSNAGDLLFDLQSKISDAGVFEKYTEIVAKFTDYLFNIPEEELQSIAEIIADSIVSLIEPVESLIDIAIKAVDWLRNLIAEHPNIAKMVLTFTAFTGVALVAIGTLLKLSGSIFMLTSGLMQTSVLFKEGIKFTNVLSKGFSALFTSILPLVAIAVTLYKVWTKNMFGIKDAVIQTFSELGDIISLTFDAFTDDTLSPEAYQKMVDLGIEPFIDSILLLKYHFGILVDGIKSGFDSVFDTINNLIPAIEPVKGFMYDIANKVGGFISKFTVVGASDGWEKFGKIIGKVAGVITVLLPAIKALKIVIGLFSGPIGIIISIISLLGIAWKTNFLGIQDKVKEVFDWFKGLNWEEIWGRIATTFQAVWDKIIYYANIVWEWLKPIVDATISLFISIFEAVTDDKTITPILKIFGLVFDSIWGLVKDIAPIIGVIFGVIQTVITAIFNCMSKYIIPATSKIAARISDFCMRVVNVFHSLVNVVRPIIRQLVDWVQRAWNGWLKGLVENVVGFVGRVYEFLSGVGTFVYDFIIKPLMVVVQFLVDVLAPAITVVVNFIVGIVSSVVDIIGGVINAIFEIFNGILDFIMGVFTGDWERAWDGICEIFKGVWDGLVSIFKGIVNALITVVNGIIGGLNLLKVPDWVPGIGGMGINIPLIPYLSTGGEIMGEGVSYLHPNEVVVNSETTDGLRDFIKDYKSQSSASGGASVIPNSGSQVDNSVTFEQGSVIIQVAGTTDTDLEAVAEKLMKIIARKQQLRGMALRNS